MEAKDGTERNGDFPIAIRFVEHSRRHSATSSSTIQPSCGCWATRFTVRGGCRWRMRYCT